ncbi:MAG: glycoside hydrolase family 130 protein [Candidatus Parvarchaeota archaeon]|nr:glycoside hydrolase family 130 protein [Candidatus Jingweiarchaeum tengchongense]
MKLILILLIFIVNLIGVTFAFDLNELYGFKQYHEPIILPYGIGFMSKATFNPTAIEKGGIIYLLFRTQDWTGTGSWNGTSRIGVASSLDGIHFAISSTPVITPTKSYEIPGGCEDPRVISHNDMYYMTYTGYNGVTAQLCEAVSTDLVHWEKLGPIFPQMGWSKSGAILSTKINGKYIMYFGDTNIYIAYSDDLIHWKASPYPVLTPRPGMFDSVLVEPGPPPIITDNGILLIYNGADYSHEYAVGAVLFSKVDPTQVVERLDDPFLKPVQSWEKYGQTPNVVFAEGLVILKDEWLLYYGAADTYIGVAILNTNKK